MANHSSTKKSLHTTAAKCLQNKYLKKSSKTFVKKLRLLQDKSVASEQLKSANKMLDKLAKKRIFHPNKSARIKSQLAIFVNGLKASSS